MHSPYIGPCLYNTEKADVPLGETSQILHQLLRPALQRPALRRHRLTFTANARRSSRIRRKTDNGRHNKLPVVEKFLHDAQRGALCGYGNLPQSRVPGRPSHHLQASDHPVVESQSRADG
ncbi:hypothetical protein N7445_003045 [Penicillium cf. griseofulvum]|nr:hypothetical protein N7445_003045 [Penicillium cf. griseofulvum]